MIPNGLGAIFQPIDKFFYGVMHRSTLTYASSSHPTSIQSLIPNLIHLISHLISHSIQPVSHQSNPPISHIPIPSIPPSTPLIHPHPIPHTSNPNYTLIPNPSLYIPSNPSYSPLHPTSIPIPLILPTTHSNPYNTHLIHSIYLSLTSPI